jgi:hypothetical protein
MNDQANSLMSIAFIFLSIGLSIILGAVVFDSRWIKIGLFPVAASFVLMLDIIFNKAKDEAIK